MTARKTAAIILGGLLAINCNCIFISPVFAQELEYRAENAFSPEGKVVLLCDDIMTTGSTLNECAKMLRLSGAKDVICVTAAITKKRVDKKD